MTPRFIGDVNFARMNPSARDRWQLEEPFAQVSADGFLAIARPWKYINGASIPRFLWPVLGHPFSDKNKFWSVVHDQGHTNDALVIRLSDVPDIAPETMMERMPSGGWVYELFRDRHAKRPRHWYDTRMVEAMELLNESRCKQAICWTGVRAGGWKAWNENHCKEKNS